MTIVQAPYIIDDLQTHNCSNSDTYIGPRAEV